MITIRSCNDDLYGDTIAQVLSRAFPANLSNKAQVVDSLTDAFVASSQTRLGPAPKPEGLVAIRRVIRLAMDTQSPIPVLVPWGSKKAANNVGVDVAEIAALRTLQALNERVTRYWSPGVEIDLGIEDAGGRYLWKDDADAIAASVRYVAELSNLVEALDLDSFIHAVPESANVEQSAFNNRAALMETRILKHLLDPSNDRAWADVIAFGWRGDLPQEMTDYYLGRYENIYPNSSREYKITKLAAYFAQSWARYDLGIKVRPAWRGNFIQVNLTEPIPGLPAVLGDRRIHYRTLPLKMARTAMPPWRAKGYIAIENRDAMIKLASFHESGHDYVKHDIEVRNDEKDVMVIVGADYEIRS